MIKNEGSNPDHSGFTATIYAAIRSPTTQLEHLRNSEEQGLLEVSTVQTTLTFAFHDSLNNQVYSPGRTILRRQYGRVRRRDGAYQWGIYRDIEVANRFVETFLVHSWAEHLRQHERQTKGDRELEQRVYGYVVGEPKVRHLLYADA